MILLPRFRVFFFVVSILFYRLFLLPFKLFPQPLASAEIDFFSANTTVFVTLPSSPSTALEADFCNCGLHGIPFTGGGGVQSVWVNTTLALPTREDELGKMTVGVGTITRPLVLPSNVITASNCHCQCSAGYLLPKCRYRAEDPNVVLGLWLVPKSAVAEMPPLVSEDVLNELCVTIIHSVAMCTGKEENFSSTCEQTYLSLMTFQYTVTPHLLHFSREEGNLSFFPPTIQFIVSLPGWMAQVVMAAIEIDLQSKSNFRNDSWNRSCIVSSLSKSSLFNFSLPLENVYDEMEVKIDKKAASLPFTYSSSSHSLNSNSFFSTLPWTVVGVEELSMEKPPPLPFRNQWLRLYSTSNSSSEGGLPGWSIAAPNCVWILGATLIIFFVFFVERQ